MKRESIIITIVVFTLKIKLNEQIVYAKILCGVWNKSVNVAHVEVQVSFTLFVKFPVCVTHISNAHMFEFPRNISAAKPDNDKKITGAYYLQSTYKTNKSTGMREKVLRWFKKFKLIWWHDLMFFF